MIRSLIAVDGADGSGKSRFAERLAATCAAEGLPATVVHVDDFRRPVDFAAAPDEAAAYYERYYDIPALERCLRAFLEGVEQVVVPRFDSARGALEGEQELAFGRVPLCVVEGVFVLRVPAAAAAPLVALEVGADEARRRILERDAARGRPPEEIERRLLRRYLPAQLRYRAELDPSARADVLIDNERWEQPRALRCEVARFPIAARRALLRLIPS
jgi:uridine kinase